MNSFSVMELNTKSPFLWDLDNLVVFPSRATDVPKKLQLVDSGFEPLEGFEIGTFQSSGGRSDGGSGSGCASDLGYGSSSKSTKSASVDSSSYREIRESKVTLGASDLDFSQDQSTRKGPVSAWPTRTPSMTDVSIGSGDSLIGLKLGKRTYFEDVSGSNNGKASAAAAAAVPELSYVTGKRSKLSSQSAETLRCQVEGCNLDLSSAKGYHRKHRVCESHAKSPKVMICGVERRFCQQCSRFHSLSEFDQKKRSCRRRLSDHNARRRKPTPDVIQFSSMRLPSSLHEGRNQISLAFNQVPMVQTRPNSNATWDFTSNSKKLGLFSPKKPGCIDTLQVTPVNDEPHETGFKLSYDSTQLMSPNGTTAEVFHHQGYQVSTTTNNMNTAPELRALSLLSTNSWGAFSQEPTPPPPHPQLDQSSLLHHHHNQSHDMPAMSAEYWPGEQQQAVSSFSMQVPSLQRNGSTNPSQEFQLFRAPNETGFYSYEGLR